MKEYEDKKPIITVGGTVGSFLGEYLAGGIIIVLGLNTDACPVGNFTGTGMHGGKILIRSQEEPKYLPKQVCVNRADEEDLRSVKEYLEEFAALFGYGMDEIMSKSFYRLTPNARNPYKRLYTYN